MCARAETDSIQAWGLRGTRVVAATAMVCVDTGIDASTALLIFSLALAYTVDARCRSAAVLAANAAIDIVVWQIGVDLSVAVVILIIAGLDIAGEVATIAVVTVITTAHRWRVAVTILVECGECAQ